MIRISINKNSQTTNQGLFPSTEEAQAWLTKHEGIKSFGQPKQVVQQQVELSPAVIAEDGSVLQEAVIESKEIEIAADYEVVIEDLTAKLEQEKINAEALAFLAATDYIIIRAMERGEEVSAEIKAERQAARNRVVR